MKIEVTRTALTGDQWTKVYTAVTDQMANINIVNTGTKATKVYVAISKSATPAAGDPIEQASDLAVGAPLLRLGEPLEGGEFIYIKFADVDATGAARVCGIAQE